MIPFESLMPAFDETRRGAKVSMETTLPKALLGAVRTYGNESIVVDDAQIGALSYQEFLSRSLALTSTFSKKLGAEEKQIALMLPTSVSMMLCFFGAQFAGRIATMINFTSGVGPISMACKTACVQTLVTSSAFVERVHLQPVVEAIRSAGITVLFLEDILMEIAQSREGAKASLDEIENGLPLQKPDDPAVILFTSGSEGTPKGVVLSHKNILANIAQFTETLDVGAWDRMFACLPLYHSFGLTVGALLPVMTGMYAYYYPSPLHYHEVPKMIGQTKSTLLLSTDTFLTGYARSATRGDLESLRYIVGGAEKLKDQTRNTWATRFGKLIMEGYGVTETAPVLCVNRPDFYCIGSVGPILPHVELELKPVDGIAEGGELWVRGPNVMLGYMKADNPGVIQPPVDGWHNTGDVVTVGPKGHITIRGRIKRFAKIGGEMVSLVAIEQATALLYADAVHVVVSIPHAHRGEIIVLMTECQKVELDDLRKHIKKQGLSDLCVPREVIAVDKVPVLGSGKIDFITARTRVMEILLGEKESLHRVA